MSQKQAFERDLTIWPAPSEALAKAQAPLLWVDLSGSKGTREANSVSKRSHVLRNFHRIARHEYCSGLQVSKPLDGSENAAFDLRPFTTKFKLENAPRQRRRKNRKHEDDGNEGMIEQERPVSNIAGSRAVAALGTSLTGSLWQIAGEFVDPFDSIGMGLDPGMGNHLKYFRFQFSKAVQPFRGEDWFSLWMKYAVNCRPVMGILLSVSTAHQAEVRANGREELITATLRYKLNSLKHLNSALATAGCEVSEDLLHAVGSHAAIEAITMNVAAAEAHMDGLEKMIEMGGGLEAFSHDGIVQVFMANAKIAQASQKRPRLKMPQSYRKSIPTLDRLLEFEQNPPPNTKWMGSRFFDDDLIPYFSTSFVSLLHRFRGLLIYQEVGLHNPEIFAEGDDDMINVFEHDFIESKYEERVSPLQECFIEAVLIFNESNLRNCGAFAINRRMLSILKALLDQHFDALLAIAPDALLWMLHLGMTTSQWYSAAPSGWFSTQMTRVAHMLGTRSWLQMKAFLQGYFFIDRRPDGIENNFEVTWQTTTKDNHWVDVFPSEMSCEKDSLLP